MNEIVYISLARNTKIYAVLNKTHSGNSLKKFKATVMVTCKEVPLVIINIYCMHLTVHMMEII